MINPKSRRSLRHLVVGAGCLAATVALTVVGGCAEEPEPVVRAPVAPPPPPPPPKPRITPIADLMAQLKIDERIVLPEEKAPKTDPERIAVLEFFDAFARGDDRTLHGMLPLADGLELEALVETGLWESRTKEITTIEIECGPSVNGNCALALFHVGDEYEPQLWYLHREGDEFTFEAAPTPPGILDRLTGTDWIEAWHRVLEEELALANQPDQDVETPQRILDSDTDNPSSSSAGGGGGGSPNSPGGTKPGRRPPPRTPRKPPGG